MLKSKTAGLFVLLSATILAGPAWAVAWSVDENHTEVNFSEVLEAPRDRSEEVASVNTGNAKRYFR